MQKRGLEMKIKKYIRTSVCILLVFCIAFCFGACKKKDKKNDEIGLIKSLLSDRIEKNEVKDKNGITAYKIEYTLPQIDATEYPAWESFNSLFNVIFADAGSNANNVIANSVYTKGKPWIEQASYKITYFSKELISIVVEIKTTTTSGNTLVSYKPIVYSFISCERCSLADFSGYSEDEVTESMLKVITIAMQAQGNGVPVGTVLNDAFSLEEFSLTEDTVTVYLKPDLIKSYGDIETVFEFERESLEVLLTKLPSDK